ncbi:MAG: alkaline phosphatase D family protein [Stagnimonas sp.]|nr:alkaline phosphatase D family protein [Stagnimonas sp.]
MPPSLDFTRRRLLQVLGAGLAAPLLPGCTRSETAELALPPAGAPLARVVPAPAPETSPGPLSAAFQHGVASGDPLSDRVILWTRVTQSPAATVSVAWLIARDPLLSDIVAQGSVSAEAARDYIVKVEVEGLSPGNSYYYRFFLPDGGSAIGRTRTLPEGAVEQLRIALVTCSNSGSVFNAYARVAERADLDLVLHLGDYIYADSDFTLAQYRSRHLAYKADNPELRELHRQHPMIAIWDDHETCNDAYTEGAPPPNPYLGPLWPLRRDAATQAYFEYLPIRDHADGSRRIYREFQFGGLADLFMLDGRFEGRSKQVSGESDPARDDASRSMLGPEQEQWLAGRLRGSTARWKLIGNQTMLGHLNEITTTGAKTNNWMDQWDGYPPARQRLYNVLKGDATQAKVDNAIVCTGDWHNSFIMDLPEDPLAGYDGASGAGSLAVEYVTPSVTSGFFGVSELATYSPHIKHHDDSLHGYVLLDLRPERVVGEMWVVDTVSAVSAAESLFVAFETRAGENRLRPYTAGPTRHGS